MSPVLCQLVDKINTIARQTACSGSCLLRVKQRIICGDILHDTATSTGDLKKRRIIARGSHSASSEGHN